MLVQQPQPGLEELMRYLDSKSIVSTLLDQTPPASPLKIHRVRTLGLLSIIFVAVIFRLSNIG